MIKKFPSYIQIETINICNANCNMCSLKLSTRKKEKISDKLFFKILLDLCKYKDKIKRVTPQLFGEPLLDDTIYDKIYALKEIGIKEVVMATNGSLLDMDASYKLINSKLDCLDLSIDGLYKKTYEKIRIGLNHKIVYENINNFIKLRNKLNSDMKIRIRMAIQDINKNEYEKFRNYWMGKLSSKDSVYGANVYNWEGMELSNLTRQISHYITNKPCKSLWNSFIIQVDGRVSLCCADYDCKYEMGDINNQTIEEIWNNKKFTEFRKLHKQHKRQQIPICKNCNIWEDERKNIWI